MREAQPSKIEVQNLIQVQSNFLSPKLFAYDILHVENEYQKAGLEGGHRSFKTDKDDSCSDHIDSKKIKLNANSCHVGTGNRIDCSTSDS